MYSWCMHSTVFARFKLSFWCFYSYIFHLFFSFLLTTLFYSPRWRSFFFQTVVNINRVSLVQKPWTYFFFFIPRLNTKTFNTVGIDRRFFSFFLEGESVFGDRSSLSFYANFSRKLILRVFNLIELTERLEIIVSSSMRAGNWRGYRLADRDRGELSSHRR